MYNNMDMDIEIKNNNYDDDDAYITCMNKFLTSLLCFCVSVCHIHIVSYLNPRNEFSVIAR